MRAVVTLYRPEGPEEFELIKQAGRGRFAPRLAEQPIFYPVLQEATPPGSRATGRCGKAAQAL